MHLKYQRSLITLIALIYTTNIFAQEKLIFAIDLIRHGDRTPTHEIPNFPHHWKQGFGELTAEGMYQEFQLGTQLRKKYIDQNHLLPSHYQAESIYVRSSDFNRTLMSAESLLIGLYPLGTGPYLSDLDKPALPSAYQPIPIHTVPQEQETLFIYDKNKEKYKTLLIKYVFPKKEWQQKTNELQNKFKYWSDATSIPITHLYQLMALGDTLYIRQLHHIPLPNGIDSKNAEKIISTAMWIFTTIFKCKEITDPIGHTMLTTIADYLEQASQQKTNLKYFLLLGHDSTISCVLNTLETPLNEWPPYASDLNFSLFENNKKYYVKISYNNKPVTIPACGGNSCSLSKFIELTKK